MPVPGLFTHTMEVRSVDSKIVIVLKKCYVITVLYLLISVNLSAQFLYFRGKEINPNQTYIIILSNGTQTSGKVLSVVDGESITIQFSKNSMYTYKYDQVVSINEFAPANISVGAGFGIPYGILGMSLEVKPVDYVGFTAGIGSALFIGVGWSVGTRFYFTPSGSQFSPFISGYYGINGLINIRDEYTYRSTISETYPGFSGGGGLTYSIDEMRKHAATLEILYIFNPKFYDRADILKYTYNLSEFGLFPVKFAVGYRYTF
jgi:hypothetical protein